MPPILLTTIGTLVVLLALILVATALLALVFAPFDESDEPLARLHDDEEDRR